MRVLNLGAGVQSTTLYLMAIDGEIQFDLAIFADTQDEPRAVYEHLEYLRSLGGPEIAVVSRGNLGDNLINGINATGQRFVSIPSYLKHPGSGREGIGRRQCTREFKIDPIRLEIRRRLGLEKGQRAPAGTMVTQLFGLSFDEPKRVARVTDSFRGHKWMEAEFPLFDWMMTRAECLDYLKQRLPDRAVPRSACVYCPYHNDDEWLRIKEDPEDWARAVEIDEAIRYPSSACTRDMEASQYLHKSCVPLAEVELKPSPPDQQKRISWSVNDRECEGMCGL